MFSQEPLGPVDWYYPERLTIDTQAARSLTRTPAAKVLGLRLTHLHQVDVPLYVIQTSLGGTDNAVAKAARAYQRRLEDPQRDDRQPGFVVRPPRPAAGDARRATRSCRPSCPGFATCPATDDFAARPAVTLESLWSAVAPVGRDERSGGYRRFAWTPADAAMREWFTAECSARGLIWRVTGPATSGHGGGTPTRPGAPVGPAWSPAPTSTRCLTAARSTDRSGYVSALAAVDLLRERGVTPSRPIGIVNFVDEEGARFGVACAGSRLLTGGLTADRARGLT